MIAIVPTRGVEAEGESTVARAASLRRRSDAEGVTG